MLPIQSSAGERSNLQVFDDHLESPDYAPLLTVENGALFY